MPTRRPDAVAAVEREARWQKDHAAYRRLHKDGLNPKVLDGAAQLEQRANSSIEIEHGLDAPKEIVDAT